MDTSNIINFNDFFKKNTPEFDKEQFKEFISNTNKLNEQEEKEPESKPILENVVIEEEEIKPIIEDNYYSIYKDKVEDFKFEIQLEGDAKLENTQARLILESDEWTLMFVGDIDKRGLCTIPMKKLGIFEEGTIGKIKVEVISDNTMFVPWEDEFKVKLSKKVSIKLNETKASKPEPKQTGVKINLKH